MEIKASSMETQECAHWCCFFKKPSLTYVKTSNMPVLAGETFYLSQISTIIFSNADILPPTPFVPCQQ